MRIRFLFFLLAFLIWPLAQASTGGPIYGSTQMEREIRWVWSHLNDFSVSCTQSSSDCQKPELKAVILELNSYLPASGSLNSGKWDSLLQFVSENDRPDLFKSGAGETHRVVMTGADRFSQVFVNTDRMNMPLEDMIGLLTHEAVHHLGILDDAQRFPDFVGAEVAKHFKSQQQRSTLEQFNVPETQAVIFNSLAARESVGFVSWGDYTSDVNWAGREVLPVCGPGEKLVKEDVGAVAWKVNYINSKVGRVSVRGGGLLRAECQTSMGRKRPVIMPIDAGMELQYPMPFDFNNWQSQKPVPTHEGVRMGPSPNPADHMFGAGQTFIVESINHSKAQLTAGETLKTVMAVRSVDNFQPATCQLLIAGTQYSLITQDNLPGVNFYSDCRLKSLGGGKYSVEGEITFPEETRPDFFYVPVVIFSNPNEDRVAIPVVPTLIQVSNSHTMPLPYTESVRLPGMPAAKTFGNSQSTNSYLVKPGQIFTVEFDVFGSVELGDMWFDLDLWIQGQREFVPLLLTGYQDKLPEIFQKTEIKKMNDRSRVIMTFKMPAQFQGIEICALKFSRFYIRTSDFSWAEVRNSGLHDSMAINPKWGN